MEVKISPRETQILQLMSNGLSAKQIADMLCISVHTVNNHRANMLCATRSKSAMELVKKATLQGLLV